MRENRLLERLITNDYPDDNRHQTSDLDRLVTSVTRHIQRILNTRQGSALIDPEFGIPDFSNLPGDFASPETEALAETIQKAVEKYEPRLQDVAVNFEGTVTNALSISFHLSGTIFHKKKKVPIVLRTDVSSDNTFKISNSNVSTTKGIKNYV